jgi:hypothetical protein
MLVASLYPLLPFAAHPLSAFAIFFDIPLPILVAFIVAAVFIVGMSVRGIIFLNRRHEEMNAVATRLGLRLWPDNSLPRGLSLNGTPFFNAHKLTNIHEGILNSNEIVFLDFHKQESESRWSRTIIAIKARSPLPTPPNLESHKSGAWQLFYAPVGYSNSADLMEVDRLELLIQNLVR